MKITSSLLLALLLALASLSSLNGAIIIESSALNKNSDDSDLTFNLVDESGGNTSSILLVGVSARLFSTPASFDEITIDYGGSTDVSGILLGAKNEVVANNGTVIYGFDLGNVSGSQIITINNTSSQTTDEVFTVFQLSGATLSGYIANGSSGNPGSPFQMTTTLDGVESGSFVFAVGSDRQGRPYEGAIGTSDSDGSVTPNRGASYLYDLNSVGGNLTVGFDWDGDGLKTVSAVAIVDIPEPGVSALLGGFFALGFVMLRRR